jgi:sensor histidine kinase YesM
VGGYVLGTLAGDLWFGWSSWDTHPAARAQLPVSMVVTALAGIAGTYYFYSKHRSAWLSRQADEASRQAAESRLRLLEAQIEPHMLFNTLANLRALIGVDPPRAQAMLDHLNAYLRSTLQASRASMHPLADEFARIRDYLELMAVRMGPRLIFEIVLPPALAHRPVPPLILQPLVENAIVHGLEPSVPGGCIRVSAQLLDDTLHLQVADTGLGATGLADPVHDGPLGLSGGFGLSQVRERLRTLYGEAASLELGAKVHEGSRWTCASLVIPVAA